MWNLIDYNRPIGETTMMKIKTSIILSLAISLASLFISTQSFAEEVRSLGVKTVSWYGKPFHGRLTANGERYNMHGISVAHKSLKFGTKVRLTCTSTGKSVVARVNDRGPYVGNRAFDLSYGAAKAIGIVDRGIAKVKVEILN